MNNFSKNALGGLLVTFYLFCFEFGIMLFYQVIGEHMPIGDFLISQLVNFFLVWFIATMVVGFFRDMIAAANTPRDRDRTDRDSTDKNSTNRNRNSTNTGNDKDQNGSNDGPKQ